MLNPPTIFIGWEPREADAYRVTEASLRKHARGPLNVVRLDREALRWAGLYRRSNRDTATRVDTVDRQHYSTEFSFTRFLIPALMQYRDFALFVDCDWLFRSDVYELFDNTNPVSAAQCVHHDFAPAWGTKMDGAVQDTYPRKNWSSLVMWNCGHEANRAITPDTVSNRDGSYLHRFGWLPHVTDVGDIDEAWNWLPGHSSPAINPKGVHFTEGVPSMAGYENVAFADEWRSYLAAEVTA